MTSQATWQTDLLWNYKAKRFTIIFASSIQNKLLQFSAGKSHIIWAKPRLEPILVYLLKFADDNCHKLMHETTQNRHFPHHVSYTSCHITNVNTSILTVMEAKRTQIQSWTLGCPWQWMSSSTMNTPRALRAVHLRKKHLNVALSPMVENKVSLELKLLQTLQNTTGLILRHVTKNQQVYPNGRKENSYQFFFSTINN